MKLQNLTKRIGAALVALCMVAGLAACGNKTPEETIAAAMKSMSDVKSISYNMTMNMEMASGEDTVKMYSLITADCTEDPLAMKMHMSMDMGTDGASAVTMYTVADNDAYTMYMQTDGDDTWYKQTMTDLGTLEQYSAQQTMELYLSSAASFAEQGTEDINGVQTTKYSGIISGDALSEVLTSAGILSQLGLDGSVDETMFASIGNLPISVWVNPKNDMPVQYEMDMTAIMQGLLGQVVDSSSGDSITVSAVTIKMVVTATNSVSAIQLPAEAADAVEMG